MNISTSEILAALQAAGKKPIGPSDAFTAGEIRSAMGWSPEACRRNMVALKAAGNLVCVRVLRMALDDSMRDVPGYRLIKPTKKGK